MSGALHVALPRPHRKSLGRFQLRITKQLALLLRSTILERYRQAFSESAKTGLKRTNYQELLATGVGIRQWNQTTARCPMRQFSSSLLKLASTGGQLSLFQLYLAPIMVASPHPMITGTVRKEQSLRVPVVLIGIASAKAECSTDMGALRCKVGLLHYPMFRQRSGGLPDSPPLPTGLGPMSGSFLRNRKTEAEDRLLTCTKGARYHRLSEP